MAGNVLVIVGTGASYDVVPPSTKGGYLGWFKGDLKPPLTSQVFRDDEHTRTILSKYDGARALVANVRIDLENERQLEPQLRELRDEERTPVARQFPEIALYLQEFFAKVSEYTDQPINYNRLTHALFTADPRFDRIAFVTTNYETLLDDVLFPSYFEIDRNDVEINSYIGDRALLVKLHGSVNWIRRLLIPYRADSRVRFTDAEYLKLIRYLKTTGLSSGLSPEITVQDPAQGRYTQIGVEQQNRLIDITYPAISVPLGTYDPYFACPKDHVDALKEFLPECKNVLAIGTSAKDDDLLDLLKEDLPEVSNFHIVDIGLEAAEATNANFKAVPQLNYSATLHTERFSRFSVEGGIESFIESCQRD